MQTQTFYLVWNPDGHAPTHRHHALSFAEIDAARLARLHPDTAFFIMKVIGGVIYDLPLTLSNIEINDDPPF